MLGSLASVSVVLLLAGTGDSPPTTGPSAIDDQDTPPEFRGIPASEWKAALEAKLASMVGQPFPDWELRNRFGRRTLFSITEGPILLFYAGSACSCSIREVARLSANGWKAPEGRIITVLKNEIAYKQRGRELKSKPDVYYIASWTVDGLMNYIRVYPTLIVIDADHRIVAVRVGPGDEPVDSERTSIAP
jgi:hypothetical protein